MAHTMEAEKYTIQKTIEKLENIEMQSNIAYIEKMLNEILKKYGLGIEFIGMIYNLGAVKNKVIELKVGLRPSFFGGISVQFVNYMYVPID